MSLGLVSRSSRALAEHLNRYFRVFKGVDPDSVFVRLENGGAFEIRHSVTNVPILRVADTGIAAQIGTAALADNSVTSAKILNGTIVGADIQDNTIPSSRLITGAAITPGSITATELAPHAVTQSGFVSLTPGAGISVSNTNYVEIGSSGVFNLAMATTGGEILEWITLCVSVTVAPCSVYLAAVIDGGTIVGEDVVNFNAAGFQQVISLVYRHPTPTITTHTFRPLWKTSTVSSAANLYSATHLLVELKR